MKLFYSAKQNTFFNDVFHGTRTIQIDDPAWIRPTVPTIDPSWIRPSISAPNPEWVEGEDSEPETILVPDPSAVAPMIEVPDEYAKPRLITVPNPACLLPPESELVDITQDEHDAIFRALSLGGSILAPGKNGRPSVAPAPPPTLEQQTESAQRKRDNLLALAAIRIAPLQDAVDLGKGTPAKVAILKKWKEYRVDLDDIPDQAGYPQVITWPTKPA